MCIVIRLLPAGILVLITTYLFKRDLNIYRCDLKWFFVFTIVDATFFQLFLTYGIEKTGAGLGSVLIDSQPLLVAILARAIFGNLINPIGAAQNVKQECEKIMLNHFVHTKT